MMIEIESAYRRLSTEDKRILFLRYAESMDYKEISNFLSLNSDDAARMRGNRAVKRLVFKLGGFRPYLDKDTPDNKSEGEDNIVEGDKPSNYSEGNETSSEEL
jgi:hypothetical protein